MNVRTRSRREAERTVRRDYILQAAEKVFARRPFDEASMQEIAKQAGIGMHGLYRHFASKQELYEEIVIARLGEIRERMAAASRNAGPTERLRILAAAHAAHFLARPQFFPVWASHRLGREWQVGSRFGQVLERRLEEVEDQLAKAVAAAAKRGLLRPLGTRLLTDVAIGIFASVIQEELLRGKSRDADACAARMMELFFEGAEATGFRARASRPSGSTLARRSR
jgi:AcrR family transcriptional regulator